MVEVDPTLCRIIQIYRVGIWRNEGESNFRKLCIRILYFTHYCSFLFYLLAGTYQAYLSENENQLIFLVEVQITVSIVVVKLFYLLWRHDETLQFLYDPIVAHCTEDYDESVVINQKIKKITVFYKVYTLIISITIAFVILIPLPIFTKDGKSLPLFIRFDLESDYEMIFYWMTYIYASVGSVLCSVYTFLMLIIWYIMYNYSIEYSLLGHRFRTLGTTATKTYPEELIHLIRAHNNLFDTIEHFRSFFATLFLVEIVTGAISICVSTYNLAYNTTDNYFELAFYVVFALYAFFEIFLIMYLANKITAESDRLSYCLFQSNWMDQSESTKKCVIIFGEMIRKRQQLVIFMYPMNLEKFTSIVNVSYSMFNLLKRFE